jgi:DNA-binding LacI/PurR family transcriptional regulator
MTVSRILRNYPHVKAELRERVRACAREMGYRPDPALAALNRHRLAAQAGTASGERLALIVPREAVHGWGVFPVMKELEADLREEAGRIGYRVLRVGVPEDGSTLPAELRKLYNKGIRGLAIASAVNIGEVADGQWGDFAVVMMGLRREGNRFHAVTISFNRMAYFAFQVLARAGMRRIGYIAGKVDSFSEYHPVSPLAAIRQDFKEVRTEIHSMDDFDAKAREDLAEWLRRFAPEAVVSIHGDPLYWIQAHAPCGKGTVETVLLNRPREETSITGVVTPPGIFGRQSIQRLHQLLLDNALGLPDARTILIVDGIWTPATRAESVAVSALPVFP